MFRTPTHVVGPLTPCCPYSGFAVFLTLFPFLEQTRLRKSSSSVFLSSSGCLGGPVALLSLCFNHMFLLFPHHRKNSPSLLNANNSNQGNHKAEPCVPSTQMEALVLQVLAFYELWSECNRTKFLILCMTYLLLLAPVSALRLFGVFFFFFTCLASFEFKAGDDKNENITGSFKESSLS